MRAAVCLSAILYTPAVKPARGLLVRNVAFDSSPTSGDHICGCPGGVKPAPGGGGVGSVVFDLVLAGTVSDFTPSQQALLQSKLSQVGVCSESTPADLLLSMPALNAT